MISVALCTYNGERYIRDQLDSILSQTMPVDEIIIRDDCSKDSTCVILEEYASRYPQIDFKRNHTNKGFVKNFENAITNCLGDYIFLSDQDDIWMPDKVEIMVGFLENSGMYGVYTDGVLIDQKGKSLDETLFSRLLLLPYIEHNLLDKYEFEITCLNYNHVTGATLAITQKAKDILLPFRTTQVFLHDMWISIKLSSLNKLGRIDRPLISYRLHDDQGCGLNMDNNKDILIDNFIGRGSCASLRNIRKRTIILIKLYKFSRVEKKRVFNIYKTLYIKALGGKSTIKDVILFILTEIFVCLRSVNGSLLSIKFFTKFLAKLII